MSDDKKTPGLTLMQQALVRDPEAQLMVKRLALRIKRRYRELVRLADLLAQGILGLAEAARTYDRDRGATFADFAFGRVRGLMMNLVRHETRQQQAASRGVYRFVEGVCDEANVLRDTEEDQRRSQAEFSDMLMAAGTLELVGEMSRTGPAGGEALAVRRDLVARGVAGLDLTMSGMSDVEQELLRRHYHEEEDLAKIVSAMGLRNYADARRIHKKALVKLAIRLRAVGVTEKVLDGFA